MHRLSVRRTSGLLVLAASLALGTAGCDGIQFNGKLFDAVGLSSTDSVKSEPRLAERAPLVPPPRTDQLPPPGGITTGSIQPEPHMAWPNDPDQRRAAQKAAAGLTKQDCDETKMLGRPDFERQEWLAACRNATGGGLLGSVTNMFKKNKDGAAATTTVEDDAAEPPKPAAAPAARAAGTRSAPVR